MNSEGERQRPKKGGKAKRRIIAAAVFLLVTAALIFLLQALLVPKYMSFPYDGALVREYYDSVPEHDVIFLGDCEFYECVNPAVIWSEYGIPVYVRGSSQQLIWDSYYFLLETLKYEKPKAVVFNAVEMKIGRVQHEEYTRLTLDGMRLSKYKLAAAKMSLTEGESLASYVFPIIRYHERWKELGEEDFRYMFRRDTVSYNGYLMMTGIRAKTSTVDPPALADYSFPDICVEYLDRIRLLCRDNGIEFIILKAPTDTWHYPWHDEWEAWMRDYAVANGVRYYSAIRSASEIGTDWTTDSYDGGDHMNYIGAEKVSRWFGAILRDEFDLPDRRAGGEGGLSAGALAEWAALTDRYAAAAAEAGEAAENAG